MLDGGLNIDHDLNSLLDKITEKALVISDRGIGFPLPYKEITTNGLSEKLFHNKFLKAVTKLLEKIFN